MSRGIRARITSLSAVAVLVVLVAAAVALVTAQRTILTDSVDEVLDRHASTLEQFVRTDMIPPVIPGQGDDDSFAAIVERSGRHVSETAGFPAGVSRAVPSDGIRRTTVDGLADSASFRMRTSTAGGFAIVVGTPMDDVDESVTTLTRGLAITVPLVSAVLALIVWLTVGGVLGPVERIRRRVETIGDANLDERVPDPETGDEISRLAKTMNDMLGRLETSAARQRGFIGDASHELRSPVARLRARLEVDVAYPDGADVRETHRIVLDELDGLQSLVDDLLLLAQTERGRLGGRDLVDLDDIVLSEASALKLSIGDRLDVSQVTAAQVIGHPGRLARLVRNLLDNAVAHGEGRIRVGLSDEDGRAVFVVADDGRGIQPSEHERVFERFARLDESRSRGTGGAGLGLSIALQIARAHGGDIRVESDGVRGTTFVVTLPTAGSSQPSLPSAIAPMSKPQVH